MHSSTIYLFLIICSTFAATQGVIVNTSIGSLKGYQVEAKNGKIVNIFKHVPYAAPPIGELRFQKPRPPWRWRDLRDATEYGPACMSNSTTTRSPQKWVDEDCLHVNIFAGDTCLEDPCPVVVYIHGGDFNYDSAVMFRDEPLVNNFAANDVVLVIPGFRLGFFGLLTFDTDEIVPRNVGAYDLLAALTFVKSEIRNFGGNPNDVTLFGHSGGASASAQFSLSKKIDPKRRLFQKAVLMSMHFTFSNITHMEHLTMELAHRAKCSPSRTFRNKSTVFVEGIVKCLREVDSMEILRIQREMEEESQFLKPEGLVMTPPLFEARNLQELLKNPPPRSIVTGTTSLEMDGSNDPSVLAIMDLLGIKNKEDVLKRYIEDKRSQKQPFNHTSSTQAIFISSYVVGHSIRKARGNVFLYSYANSRHPMHTDDLSYIMGVHPFEHDPNEAVIAVIYPKLFLDFVKYGRPRRDWTPLYANLDNYMNIDVNVNDGTLPEMKLHYESDVIDYWKNLMDYDKQITVFRKLGTKPRAMAVSKAAAESSTGRDLSLLELLLPLLAVVFTVLLVRFLVFRRQKQLLQSEQSEKTPLFS